MPNVDPYAVLGLGRDAGPEEVRAAFRRAVMAQHPDTAGADGDAAAVRQVIDAYRLLIDPAARARHDESRTPATSPGPAQYRIRAQRQPPPHTSPTATASCPACGGIGMVRSTPPCPSCRGRAEITVLDGQRSRVSRCRRCLGRGHVSIIRRCPVCCE